MIKDLTKEIQQKFPNLFNRKDKFICLQPEEVNGITFLKVRDLLKTEPLIKYVVSFEEGAVLNEEEKVIDSKAELFKKLGKLNFELSLPDYCSPSRMWSFLSSKQQFLQSYVFKLKTKTTDAQQKGKDNHEFIYWALEKELKDLVIMPDFGSLRKNDTTTAEEGKENKLKKENWLKANEKNMIVEPDQLQLFISLKALFVEKPELKEALIEAKEKGRVESLIHSKEFKIKGIPDFIGNASAIDQKGDRRKEFLENPKLWFKYEERKKTMQAVFYKQILNEIYGKKYDFHWLVFCNTHPFGVRVFDFYEGYLEDLRNICFYAKNCYLKQYLVFCEKVKDVLGYDPFIKETYEGDAVSDWVKLNKLIDEEYLKLKGKIEVIKPSDYAVEELEREKVEAGLYEGV